MGNSRMHQEREPLKHTSTLPQYSLTSCCSPLVKINALVGIQSTKKGMVIKLKGKKKLLWDWGYTTCSIINFKNHVKLDFVIKYLHSSLYLYIFAL